MGSTLQSQEDGVPPICMVVVKDDDLHVISSFLSAYGGGGYCYHKIHATHSMKDATTRPEVVGRDVFAALDQFYRVPSTKDEPKGSPLDELATGDRWKFWVGAREVSISPENETHIFRLVGAYYYTKQGFENLKNCKAQLPPSATAETLGRAVMDLLEKIAKQAKK